MRITPSALTVRLRAATRLVLARGDDAVVCSFCGRDRRQVARLVCGPGVAICDECARVVVDFAAASGQVPPGAGRQLLTVTPVLDPGERLTTEQQVRLPEVLTQCAAIADGRLAGWSYRVSPEVGDHLTFDVSYPAETKATQRDDLRIACRQALGLSPTAWLEPSKVGPAVIPDPPGNT